MDEYF